MSRLKDTWEEGWDAWGEAIAINPAHQLRINAILHSVFDQVGSAQNILEIGSGQGDLAKLILSRDHSCSYLGLDSSTHALKKAEQKCPDGMFQIWDLLADQPTPDCYRKWADCVIISEMLEHFADPVAVIRNIKGFLKPGARVIITVPGGPMSRWHIHIGHMRHYDTDGLRDVMSKAGLQNLQITRPGFPFFNLHRLVVVFAGHRLLSAISSKPNKSVSTSTRFVLGIFRWLFKMNIDQVNRGWQLIGVGNVPE